jgi:hypothetical protein
MVSGFVDQATEWKSLASMMAGGLAYRYGRIAFLGAASRLPASVQNFSLLIRGSSALFGLGTEVATFEFTNRFLNTIRPTDPSPQSPVTDHRSPNLWSWSGKGGLMEGLLHSFITFGTLKGFGKLAGAENVIIQHGSQDLGMALGHQLTYRLGLAEKPEGTLAEQLLQAEATNLQLGAAMGLIHSLAPTLAQTERALDFTLKSSEGLSLHSSAEPMTNRLATAEAALGGRGKIFSEPKEKESEKNFSFTSSKNGEEGSPPLKVLKRDQVKEFCGETYGKWASFLAKRPNRRARAGEGFSYQDGMNLFLRYASALHESVDGEIKRPFSEIPLQVDLLKKAFQGMEYSTQSLELFSRFFREILGQTGLAPVGSPLSHGDAAPGLSSRVGPLPGFCPFLLTRNCLFGLLGPLFFATRSLLRRPSRGRKLVPIPRK